ncbi:hypothetical protein BH10BAC2_BH10BAC2_17660 [soil metagenome]
MNFKTITLVSIVFISVIVASANCKSTSATERQLAEKYCSSCHLFPEPSLLDKATWKKNILPAMGLRLGVRYLLDSPYEVRHEIKNNATTASRQDALITMDEWKKIIAYYTKNAPAEALAQNRPPIENTTDLFAVKKPFSSESNSSVTYIKIDEGNKWTYTGNAMDSSLDIYDEKLKLLTHYNIHGVMVDMQFNTPPDERGERNGVLTNIGIMNPNDLKTGSAATFRINKDADILNLEQVLDKMPRPVQTLMTDLDKDGLQDYLISGFGNTTGALYWMKNKGRQQYQQNTIRALPGTIKTYTDDFNHDGLTDIMALTAQGQEGIYLFTNKGNGTFDTKTILQFPPVYGSSYFELDDFNNDGFNDILYTCGDNADYSSHTLKNYHGVYIFLNDGNNNYTQKYFFPIHGCYKAIARDFDKDGDLDIAAISFFPDSKSQPQEAFVYMENKGMSYFGQRFQFEPYTIKAFDEGKWLTMDAGDVDGDGDEDIVLGNFSPPGNELQTIQKEASKFPFLLLENKTELKDR